MIWRGKSLPNSQIIISKNMTEKLTQFYIETFQMGIILYDFFGPDHPCHQLANYLVKNKETLGREIIPKLDVVCNELLLPEKEILRLLGLMKETIDSYLRGAQRVDLEKYKGMNLPATGSMFMTRLDEKELIMFKSNHEINLQNGDLLNVAVFPDVFKGKQYYISLKMVKLTYSGFLMMYYLREVEKPTTIQ